MAHDRKFLTGLWIGTAVLVAVVAVAGYWWVNRVPGLAGRSDPAALYDDPTLLFSDPGILGSAIEMRVTEAVRTCMEDAGQPFRDPAVIEGLDSLAGGGAEGYGIATGSAAPRPQLGEGAPGAPDRSAYEQALYGSGLAEAGGDGGCAAVGRAELDAALATLRSFPYSIEQLEADALAHPAYVASVQKWSACMADRGYPATSPEALILAQQERLATATADEAQAMADQERQIASADFACRSETIDPALTQVAADLTPTFVERNRSQLQILIPPPATDAGPLEGLGTGDVQVTLRWSSTVDLDLSVIDPSGSQVSFQNRSIPSGGQLDRDANYPCETATATGVENVFWPPGAAPTGSYRATVMYQTGCATAGTQAYELTITINGQVARRVQSTIEPGTQATVDFTFEAP